MAAATPLKLAIEGMDCAACALKIETAMNRLPGVSDVNVSVMSGSLALNVDEERTSRETIEAKIAGLGYKPVGGVPQAASALPS